MSENKIECDAFDWAYDRYVKGDDNLVKLFDEFDTKLEIARELYDLRISKGLTRDDVASLVGVSQAIIEDIEEADYQGDFLAMRDSRGGGAGVEDWKSILWNWIRQMFQDVPLCNQEKLNNEYKWLTLRF